MNADRWEVTLGQQSVQLICTGNLGYKDDNLVKLKGIQQIVQFAVLLGLGEFDVIQVQSVKSQFGVIIDVNFHGVLAELLAHRANLLAQGSTEHHYLLLMRSLTEDLLDIPTHIKRFKDTITLIKYEMLDMVKLQGLLLRKSKNTSWSTDDNMGAVILENITVGLDVDSSIENSGLDFRKVLGEPLIFVSNLECKFTSMANDENRHLILSSGESARVKLVQSC
mmetsp:Transcript_22654/g.34554  ORF Transcript_22654/g.34554 Transcript_22654/m.34554 type:complete len:223 (-) Transcript_22654:407-1075(-)